MKYFFLLFIIIPSTLFSQENNYISNKDYTEFVIYVRDSLLRRTMGEEVDEEYYLKTCYTCEESYVPTINWKAKLNVNSPFEREALEPWYYKPSERLNRKREFDMRKFIHNGVKVSPDELVWCRDSTINKSWATFLTKYYYTHSYFEDYPVQGVSGKQLQQYVRWKYPNGNFKSINDSSFVMMLKLPKEKLKFTVGEYFEFYKYTRDSIARMSLCKIYDEWRFCKSVNRFNEEIRPPVVKWKHKIKWNDEEVKEVFIGENLLTLENEIDNRLMMFSYSWLKYYNSKGGLNKERDFGWESINLGANDYIKETSPINIKKQIKNKDFLDFGKLDIWQLRAFYFWKKSKYPKEDVFDGLIPNESDLKVLRNGKIEDDFYIFKCSISTIQIK